MNRLERITSILLMLQSRKKITGAELAKHFETSVRTIYRDIRVLEEAGIPIGAEAGLGYFIMEGYNLPPVMFTKEEAAAILTGEKLLEKLGDESVNREFKTAMQKIRAVLKSSDKDFLETLEKSIEVYTMRPKPGGEFPNKFISTIQKAIVQEKVVSLQYFSQYKDETSIRQIEPIGLYYTTGTWHMMAYCRLRKAVRDFRADRIKDLRLLDETYDKTRHKSLRELVQQMNTPEELHKIVLRTESQAARYATDMKFYYGLVEEKKEGDHTEMTFMHPCLDQFSRWLVMWAGKAEIVSPPALQEKMSRLANDLYLHYGKTVSVSH